MGKTLDALADSRKERERIIQKYGFVPCSIIEPKLSFNFRPVMVFEGDRAHGQIKRERIKKNKEHVMYHGVIQEGFAISGNAVGKAGGVSTFPPALGMFILDFYSSEGDTILDPCAGHNSRMEITYEKNRSYIGYDVSERYMAFNEQVKEKLLSRNVLIKNESAIILHKQSSENMMEDGNTIDLVYTSPPYWDIEFYGEESEQLGYGKSYDEFLSGMSRVITECHRVLKPDKFCVFNVNDFRKNGRFYMYHADVARLFEQAGFTLWDIVIVKWQNCYGQIFASQVESRKVTAKMHEYLIVGKKEK
jgi:DNA modification methylase